jgi:cell wall-active antibiotic response 4TMS protein YvqF
MSTQGRCRCQSCTIRGLTGPAIVITIGVLFLLHETQGGHFEFGSTWPVLLLVIGLLQLASSFASRDGHVEAQPPSPGATPQPPAPPANPAQTYSASREQ